MFTPCSFVHPWSKLRTPPMKQSTPTLRLTDQGGACPYSPPQGQRTGESAPRCGDPVSSGDSPNFSQLALHKFIWSTDVLSI